MKSYTYPAEINLEERRAQAAKRRAALVAAGCSTYVMGLRSSRSAAGRRARRHEVDIGSGGARSTRAATVFANPLRTSAA